MPVSSLISVDGLIRLLFSIGVAAVVFAFGWAKGSQNVQHKWDAEKLKQQSAVIAQQAQTRTADRKTDDVEVKVDDQASKSLRQLEVERASLRTALGGMRQHRDYLFAVAGSEASTRAFLAENLAATADSLGQCSSRYTEVAAAHDALSIQVTGLLEIDARNLALSKNDE